MRIVGAQLVGAAHTLRACSAILASFKKALRKHVDKSSLPAGERTGGPTNNNPERRLTTAFALLSEQLFVSEVNHGQHPERWINSLWQNLRNPAIVTLLSRLSFSSGE